MKQRVQLLLRIEQLKIAINSYDDGDDVEEESEDEDENESDEKVIENENKQQVETLANEIETISQHVDEVKDSYFSSEVVETNETNVEGQAQSSPEDENIVVDVPQPPPPSSEQPMSSEPIESQESQID